MTPPRIAPLDDNALDTQLQDLAARIRAARQQANLSVDELSGATKVSVSTILRMEAGNGGVGLHNLMAVLAHLGLSLVGYPAVEDQDQLPIHPLHLDSPEVTDIIESAVSNLCDELGQLFPDAKPDLDGISSNFQGLLVDHVKAMLTGEMHHRVSHHVALKPLVYSERILGREYSLKAGADGYLVRLLGTDKVLEDGRFRPARKVSDMYTSWDTASAAVRSYVEKEEHLPGPVRIVSGWFGDDGEGVQFISRASSVKE